MIRYTTKWPYFQNLSFLENIVSVRGSNTSQNNGTGDFNNETSEYTVVSEKASETFNEQSRIKNLLKLDLNYQLRNAILATYCWGTLKPIIVTYWILI